MEPKPPSPPPAAAIPTEPGRYKLCPVCGQLFDTLDQAQVFHHGPEPHDPLA